MWVKIIFLLKIKKIFCFRSINFSFVFNLKIYFDFVGWGVNKLLMKIFFMFNYCMYNVIIQDGVLLNIK